MTPRAISAAFDGSSNNVPVYWGGFSSQHTPLFNTTPASGFPVVTPRLSSHYADSAGILVPSGWQGTVDVTLLDGVGAIWPAAFMTHGQATFAASQQATATLAKAFQDGSYRAFMGAVVITDGTLEYVIPDYSSRTPNSIILNASGNFSGSVDVVGVAGLASIVKYGGTLLTARFTGVEDYIDVTWASIPSSVIAISAAPVNSDVLVAATNVTATGCRLVPTARFTGPVEVMVLPTGLSTLQGVVASFNGTQDSVNVTWTDPGVPFSLLWGLIDSAGGIESVPWITSRTSTGCTVNTSGRFTGAVDLIVIPNV